VICAVGRTLNAYIVRCRKLPAKSLSGLDQTNVLQASRVQTMRHCLAERLKPHALDVKPPVDPVFARYEMHGRSDCYSRWSLGRDGLKVARTTADLEGCEDLHR
jgi:hypothetical protein